MCFRCMYATMFIVQRPTVDTVASSGGWLEGRGHMPPGASRGGRMGVCGNFLRHKIRKISVSSVEAGMT